MIDSSKQHDSQLRRSDFLALHDPVVKIVVEMSVSHLEVQILEDCGVVHQVEAVVDVEAVALGQDQCVADQIAVLHCGCEVVEGVAGLSQRRST